MSFSLLIYEDLPARTDLYLIPNDALTEADVKVLETANGLMINIDKLSDEQDKACELICAATTVQPEHLNPDADSTWAHRFVPYRQEGKGVLRTTITRVFRTGFYG